MDHFVDHDETAPVLRDGVALGGEAFVGPSMDAAAQEAAAVLKLLSNPQRLLLLCALVEKEMSVGELVEGLGESQSYVSAQLARLRNQGLVKAQRDGRIVRYSLSDPRVTPILERLYEVFCA